MAKKGVPVLSLISIAFIVVSFIAPFSKTGVFWIAFVFGVVAVLFQIVTWKRALGHDELKSKFLGLPIIQISAIYLVVQLLFSVLIMYFSSAPTWLVLIVSILLLLGASVGVMSGEIARDLISNTEERVANKRSFITELQLEIGALADRATNLEDKRELKSILDAVRYSDPVSSDHTADIEGIISKKVNEIKNNGVQGSLIKEIRTLLNERNQRCKAYK